MHIKFFVRKNRGVREKERFLVSLLSLFRIRHGSCTSGFVQFLVTLWLLLYQSMFVNCDCPEGTALRHQERSEFTV